MNEIRISDVTMKQTGNEISLSFKEKIELCKLLDKLGVTVIELEPIVQTKIDTLRVKSAAAAVKNSIVAVPVALNSESVQITWNALKEAKKARLQVPAPVSPVQMEYLFHKKPEAMKNAIVKAVETCRSLCADVEFVADDATRADRAFLADVIRDVIAAGAGTVTVCDAAGNLLPRELAEFVAALYEAVPELKDVVLGVSCKNTLSMADACVIAAARQGAGEIKAAAYPVDTVSLANVAKIIAARGDSFGASCGVRVAQLSRIMGQITWMCQTERSKTSPFDSGVRQEDAGIYLTVHDDGDAVAKAVAQLGYELSDEDQMRVYDAFKSIAAKKEQVSIRELDAIVASAAMQVPSAYLLDTYVINSGNTISSSAHMRLKKGDAVLEGIALGDGPIDAAFLAIEQITGRHFELDDFQIQAVTEGREAMGQTIVRLRSGGKLYSGRGISTDIVCAGIHAYLSALNKIVYEEEEA